jgi:hypothetical protein
MQVKMLRDRRRFRVGEIRDLPDGVANVLIRRGIAKAFVMEVENKNREVKTKPYYRKAVVNA